MAKKTRMMTLGEWDEVRSEISISLPAGGATWCADDDLRDRLTRTVDALFKYVEMTEGLENEDGTMDGQSVASDLGIFTKG